MMRVEGEVEGLHSSQCPDSGFGMLDVHTAIIIIIVFTLHPDSSAKRVKTSGLQFKERLSFTSACRGSRVRTILPNME